MPAAGRVLAAVAALATARNIGGLPVDVRSFIHLNQAVESGARSIEITVPEILFIHPLAVLQGKTVLHIESKIGATLSGGHRTRLFVLHRNSTLSLRGVELAHGTVHVLQNDCCGGAILARDGSELRLDSVRLTNNRATLGGAIHSNRSTVIATNCTMSANSAAEGGAVYAMQNSIIKATTCTMTSNIALAGGVALAEHSAVTAADCTITSNAASTGGGVVYAREESNIDVTGCQVTSNHAGTQGGAFYVAQSSTVTATTCTINSNWAERGGAVDTGIGDHPTFTATDCTMSFNSAHEGGAVYAALSSTVTATDCTMTSNSAHEGGAIASDGGSITATNCTLTSNVARDNGGAVCAIGNCTVTATGCTMTSNYASRGGAVAVGGDSSLTTSGCILNSNSASLSGGAILVGSSGTVDLVNSVFQSNWGGANDTDDGVSIVNFGRVQCDSATSCLPVCTVCQDEDGPSLSPTLPTFKTHNNEKGGLATFASPVLRIVLFFLFGILGFTTAIVALCRFFNFSGNQPRDGVNREVEISSLRLPLMANLEQPSATADGSGTVEHSSTDDTATPPSRNEDKDEAEHGITDDCATPLGSSEDEDQSNRRRASLPWSAIGLSPAPIFAVDDNMRILSWSPGALCGVWCGVVGPFPHNITRCICLPVLFFGQGCRSLSR